MPYIKKDTYKEEELEKEILETYKCEKYEDNFIRDLVGKQKGKLNAFSKYYKGNIEEGNWSVLKADSDIDYFDSEEIETELVDTCVSKLGKSIREKDSEYTYVFIPSYYAVKTLILYYLRYTMDAKRIYGLRNAVVRRNSKKSNKFYGGLPFILKYMKKIYKRKSYKDDSIKYDFAEVIQELLDHKIGLEINNIEDDFINDIIDCISKSHCGDYILEKRIKDFKDAKEDFYCVDFKDKLENNRELLNYTVDGYKILMHRDVEKDWPHLKEGEIKKANQIISNTPNFPKNVPPKNDPLRANIKGWFSQRVSHKDRVVYKKDYNEKTVYIATVCDHYKDAERRSRSTVAYK